MYIILFSLLKGIAGVDGPPGPKGNMVCRNHL